MDATLRKQYTTKKKIGTGTFQYLSRFLLEVLTRFELVNEGFADLCLTTWPQHRMERLTRLELATSTLARWRSTR